MDPVAQNIIAVTHCGYAVSSLFIRRGISVDWCLAWCSMVCYR